MLYLSSTIAAAVFCLILIRVELGRASFDRLHIKGNLRDGFYFSLSPSSQSIYNDFDKSILPKYASLGITGNYSAAYKIIDALCMPIKALLQTFYARFFIKGADGLRSGRKFAIKLFPIFLLYSVFAVIFLVLFSEKIPVLFGDSYKEVINIIRMLSPIIIFRAIHSLGADALTGAGMQGKRSLVHVLVAALNAVLCLVLIPANGWVGAAWASLISDGTLAILIWVIIFSSSQTMPPVPKQLDRQDVTLVESAFD